MKRAAKHVDGNKATLRRRALAGDRDALETLIAWERDDAKAGALRRAARELAKVLLTMPLVALLLLLSACGDKPDPGDPCGLAPLWGGYCWSCCVSCRDRGHLVNLCVDNGPAGSTCQCSE